MKVKLYVNTRPELSAGLRGNDFTFELDTDLDESFREEVLAEMEGMITNLLDGYDVRYIMTEEEMTTYIAGGG